MDAAPDTALLYVLRNDLELNGPKYGCGLGECGTCTVLIDGVAARSCVIPIEGCVGRDIVTLEGLGTREHPDPVQQAFIAEQAAQCGYCLNGMIMTTKALLARNPHPTETEMPRSAALQSLPLRRACRNHARGDAGRGPCRRGPATDGCPDLPDREHRRELVRRSARPRTARAFRDLHQDHGGWLGHRL